LTGPQVASSFFHDHFVGFFFLKRRLLVKISQGQGYYQGEQPQPVHPPELFQFDRPPNEGSFPSSGNRKILVVPVRFSNNSAYTDF
jgi:hypothetical protein